MIGLGVGVWLNTGAGATPALPPASFEPSDWTLVDGLGAGADTLALTIASLPGGGGSAITVLEYRVDSGSGYGAATALAGLGAGVRLIPVAASLPASVQVRAVNAVGTGDWAAAETATPSAGTAYSIFALSTAEFSRATGGVEWVAAGATAAAALTAYDAGTALGSITTARGASASPEADGGLTYDPTVAFAALADGATDTDTFGVAVVSAAQELVGQEAGLLVENFGSLEGGTWTKTAATSPTWLIWDYRSASGFAKRLVPGATITLSILATLTGALPRAYWRIFSSAPTVEGTLRTITSGVEGAVTDTLTIPADAAPGSIRLVFQVFDAATTAVVRDAGRSMVTDTVATGTVTANILGGTLISATPDFTVADAVQGDVAYLWLDPAWAGWASTSTLDWRIDGGAAQSLATLAPGLHALSALADAEAAISIRVNGGAWSPAQLVTPTASSDQRVGLWASDAIETALAATVTSVEGQSSSANANPDTYSGAASINVAPGLNAPLMLASGVEVELMGGAGTLHRRRHRNTIKTAMGAAGLPAIPEIRRRIIEPGATHLALAPGETQTRTLTFQQGGGDLTMEIVIRGRVWREWQETTLAFPLDADGDPVDFLLDREAVVGTWTDGRLFVVAPASHVSVTGALTALTAGNIYRFGGALVHVVAALGHVAPLAGWPVVDIADEPAAYSAATEPSWTAFTSATAQADSALRATVTPWSVTLSLSDSDGGEAAVRYRPAAGGRWYPAQPLLYRDFDAQTAPPATREDDFVAPFDAYAPPTGIAGWNMSDEFPGRYGGSILWLRPGVAYEVEVVIGARKWTRTITTAALKAPGKLVVAAAATWTAETTIRDNGATAVEIVQGGSVVQSITRTAGQRVELTGVVADRCSVIVTASTVTLRDPVLMQGGFQQAQLSDGTTGAADFWLHRPLLRGWGTKDARDGWSLQHSNGIGSGMDARGAAAPKRVRVLGLHTGPQRYPVNGWAQKNDATGGTSADSISSGGSHPWGGNPMGFRYGVHTDALSSASPVQEGALIVAGGETWGFDFRAFQDFHGNDTDTGWPRGPWGVGAGSMFRGVTMGGFADDAVEVETRGQALVWDCTARLRSQGDYNISPRAAVSCAGVEYGPTEVYNLRVITDDGSRATRGVSVAAYLNEYGALDTAGDVNATSRHMLVKAQRRRNGAAAQGTDRTVEVPLILTRGPVRAVNILHVGPYMAQTAVTSPVNGQGTTSLTIRSQLRNVLANQRYSDWTADLGVSQVAEQNNVLGANRGYRGGTAPSFETGTWRTAAASADYGAGDAVPNVTDVGAGARATGGNLGAC